MRWLQHQVEEGKQPQVVELSGNRLSPRMRGELDGMGAAWVGVSEQRYGRIVLTSSITGPITGYPG